MVQRIRYLSHPQVVIDPAVEICNWSLNDQGRERVQALAKSGVLSGTQTVISSTEVKAVETAKPLAAALGCALAVREDMHENDRSATGFLPAAEFEVVADQFFEQPDKSIRGWETARAAQTRIVHHVHSCLRQYTSGDLLFVGHGAVGTLLYCHLSDVPISRAYDQPAGGGCLFEFDARMGKPLSGWRPLEHLIAQGSKPKSRP